MIICGCGSDFRCFKTGLVLHDTHMYPLSRYAADAFFCPSCKAVHINRNNNEYLVSGGAGCRTTHARIVYPNGIDPRIEWDVTFKEKIKAEYGLILP